MRKKLIGFLILLLALCFITVGILQQQYDSINPFYEYMSKIG